MAPSCKRDAKPEDSETREAPASGAEPDKNAGDQWYRAVLAGTKGESIPFFLFVPAGDGQAIVQNGAQRLTAPSHRKGGEITVEFDLFHTAIEARANEHGELTGAWKSRSKSWGDAALPFSAAPVARVEPAKRFAAEGKADGAKSARGAWKLAFKDSGTAKLTLEPSAAGALTGSIHFQTGNFIFLAGEASGDRIELSAFDGSSPYLLTAKLSKDEIDGRWIAGQDLSWNEPFSGKRAGDEGDFELEHQAHASSAGATLELSQLDGQAYRDKPVIVEMSGSWCPACEYAGPVLTDLYRRYHPRGLEILTLAYEFTADKSYNEQQAERIKKKLGFAWDVVPIHGDLDAYWDIVPKALEGVNPAGFPITVFLDRNHTIVGLHSGFPNPEAEKEHSAAVASYQKLTEQIVGGSQPD